MEGEKHETFGNQGNSENQSAPLSSRKVHIGDRSRTRAEILFRIFRIDPALDGMTGQLYILLRKESC